MKPTILVYCGEDGENGKVLAASLRDGQSQVIMCAASAFEGVQRHGDRIEFAKDVPQRLRDKIAAAHGTPSPDNNYSEICNNLASKPVGYESAAFQLAPNEKITLTSPKRSRGRPRKVA